MPTSSSAGGARWVPRPVRAALLRAAAVVIPVLAAVAAGALTSAALPPARDLGDVVLAWCAVLAASTVTAVLVERLTRRLLPLATLLKLSMLFPDKAPSRYKVARKVAGTSALAAELERARKAGVHGDRQQAAETILALVGMLGDYDSRTRGHSERTQLFVSMLADELKLRAEDRDKLVWAALVHDIGKLRVPTEVLNKPGKPDDEEWRQLKAHPATGATICSPLQEWLGPWWLAIEQHHERFDGLGYPAGVAGQEISLGARIVSVADSYEVMTAARPYKRPMSATAAREELARCAGSQFDPVVVRAFLNISLGRLRWAAGPLSWIAQLPMLQPISSLGPYVAPLVGKVAGVAAGAATAGAALLGLGLGPTAADAAEPTASAPRQEQVEQDERPAPAPTTVPPTTSAPVPSPTAAPPTPTTAPSATAPAPVRPVPSASTPSPTPAPTPGTPPTSPTTPPAPPANRAPVAADDTTVTGEDAPVEVDLLANDTDPDGDALTATIGSVPAHGAATLTDGLLTYTPDGDWSGTDALTYTATDPGGLTSTATVTLTVTPVNDAPTAADDATTTPEDTPVQVDLLANDTDPDGDTLTATITTGPASGPPSLTDGVLAYAPDGDWNGTDTLTYAVHDADGESSTATLTLTVTPADDAPTAADDAGTTPEDTPVQVDLLANDTDPDGDALTATITTGPTSGTVTLTDGVLTYTPDSDRNGTDTLTYTATDPGGLTSTATVTLTVTPVNDAPTAADDAGTTPEDTPVQVDLLANDTDPDGDTLTATITTGPTSGTATLTDGLLTYTPDSDRNGTDTLTYTATDPGGLTSTATVTLTVTAVNDAPTAADDEYTVVAGVALSGSLLDNDGDEDGDPLTVVGDTSDDVDVAADGTFTWTFGSPGVRQFAYTVSDGVTTSTADVTITVTAAPPTQRLLYLHGSPHGTRGALSPTAPVASGDWDSDGQPGLTILKGGQDDDEDQVDRFHEWQYTVPAGGVTLDGPVQLQLSSRTVKLDLDGAHVDYTIWLYDCSASGGGCVQLAKADDVHVDRWSPGLGWEQRTLQIGSVHQTVPQGRVLRLRFAVDHSDVWLALDDDHPSTLTWSSTTP